MAADLDRIRGLDLRHLAPLHHRVHGRRADRERLRDLAHLQEPRHRPHRIPHYGRTMPGVETVGVLPTPAKPATASSSAIPEGSERVRAEVKPCHAPGPGLITAWFPVRILVGPLRSWNCAPARLNRKLPGRALSLRWSTPVAGRLPCSDGLRGHVQEHRRRSRPGARQGAAHFGERRRAEDGQRPGRHRGQDRPQRRAQRRHQRSARRRGRRGRHRRGEACGQGCRGRAARGPRTARRKSNRSAAPGDAGRPPEAARRPDRSSPRAASSARPGSAWRTRCSSLKNQARLNEILVSLGKTAADLGELVRNRVLTGDDEHVKMIVATAMKEVVVASEEIRVKAHEELSFVQRNATESIVFASVRRHRDHLPHLAPEPEEPPPARARDVAAPRRAQGRARRGRSPGRRAGGGAGRRAPALLAQVPRGACSGRRSRQTSPRPGTAPPRSRIQPRLPSRSHRVRPVPGDQRPGSRRASPATAP